MAVLVFDSSSGLNIEKSTIMNPQEESTASESITTARMANYQHGIVWAPGFDVATLRRIPDH